ncbi:hypothetical protein BOTBODRAFT_41203 [Botryobasidium botryosum FD-172 SS1]|uniref:Uncharacterized protein n=1 Tax=Botryobasidium botryosum (strain FD-172 SS1) TaxID=930990 RepID=A0A067N716_BOTB1|nr:hypothetical protein BOTBODRAFT_41203 [Botryobasidium botryosum FD-172 SS1]
MYLVRPQISGIIVLVVEGKPGMVLSRQGVIVGGARNGTSETTGWICSTLVALLAFSLAFNTPPRVPGHVPFTSESAGTPARHAGRYLCVTRELQRHYRWESGNRRYPCDYEQALSSSVACFTQRRIVSIHPASAGISPPTLLSRQANTSIPGQAEGYKTWCFWRQDQTAPYLALLFYAIFTNTILDRQRRLHIMTARATFQTGELVRVLPHCARYANWCGDVVKRGRVHEDIVYLVHFKDGSLEWFGECDIHSTRVAPSPQSSSSLQSTREPGEKLQKDSAVYVRSAVPGTKKTVWLLGKIVKVEDSLWKLSLGPSKNLYYKVRIEDPTTSRFTTIEISHRDGSIIPATTENAFRLAQMGYKVYSR